MTNETKHEIAKTQTMGAMISEAQVLYDSYNSGYLSQEDQARLHYLRSEYKKVRGVEMNLKFNPA